MSKCASPSNNRGLSEESGPAKRHAEEERKSSEPSKRARRSSSRLAPDDTGDFILVSSGNRYKRTSIDVKAEGQSVPYEDLQSPFGTTRPDCETSEEILQKALDQWNSFPSSPKVAEAVRPQTPESARERGFNSASLSERSFSLKDVPGQQGSATSPRESMDSVAPDSEWSYTLGGEHARGVVARTPGSESHADMNLVSRRSSAQAQADVDPRSSATPPSTGKQRTPLPARRESSPSQNAAIASRLILINLPEHLQSPAAKVSGQSRDATERSWRNEAFENHTATGGHNSQGTSASSWSISDSRRESQNESHRPKLDSPAGNSGYPAASTVLSNVHTRIPGPFTTFPSSFSVLTTESVQQKYQTRHGKRRGRKPGSHNDERPKTDLPAIVPEPELDRSVRLISGTGLPKQTPGLASHPQQAVRSAREVPAIPVSHGLYQTKLPPRPTTTPPPVPAYPSETSRSPALAFLVDNGVQTEKGTSDIQLLVNSFKHNARAILPGFNKQNSVHEIDIIMFESLPAFYKWYSDRTGIREIGPLLFELIDVDWQHEKSFVVPEGSLDYFRTLKQYIWDLYWVAMDMNKALGMFRVIISQFPPRGDSSTAGDAPAHVWKAVNSNTSSKFISTSTSQGIMVVPTGVPKEFQPQAQTSPPVHPLSILPPPAPLRLTHNSSKSSSINDPKLSPCNTLPPGLPSPSQSPCQHGPYSRDTFQHQLPSLYGPADRIRAAWEENLMRSFAYSLKLHDASLMEEESTVKDKLPYKTGAEVCAVVVDRMSGKGLVTVSGKGYITLNIPTGPEETGERFKDVTIQPKQTCMLHGGAVVLYFKRTAGLPPPPPPPPRPIIPRAETDERLGRPPGMNYDQGTNQDSSQERYRDDHPLPPPPALSSQQHHPPQLLLREDSQASASTPSTVDIKIRVQIDGTGRFSPSFDKSVLRPKLTTAEFFAWFATQSRHSPPQPPHRLRFTFKDAMPTPQATEITAGNEDHFHYMRRDIKAQCEKARRFMPDLREFVVLVTVPGWVSPGVVEDDEDW